MVRKRIAALATTMVLLANGIIYPATAVVTNIDYDSDTFTVTKANGHVYEVEGVEDLQVGDVMSLLMFNNFTGTDTTDDEVISARYSGFIASDIE